MASALTKPNQQITTLRQMLEQAKPRIAAVLPRHMNADRMLKLALVAASSNAQLAQCEPISVVRAVMLAAQLGLDPFGALGEAYLVPYGKTCTLIPGYRGLAKLARNSGEVAMIEARAVYKGDRLAYAFGLEPKLDHMPGGDEPTNEDLTHAYAVVRYKAGGAQFDVMTRGQVDAIRRRSKASGSGPWVTDYAAMACKTVVRRLLKLVPMSPELAQAVAADERADAGEDQMAGIIDVMPEDVSQPPTQAEALKAQLSAAKGETVVGAQVVPEGQMTIA